MPSVKTGSCSNSRSHRGLGAALLSELLHRAPGRLVGHAPEPADKRRIHRDPALAPGRPTLLPARPVRRGNWSAPGDGHHLAESERQALLRY